MVTREDLEMYSTEILKLFERESISSVDGLQKKLGESFKVEEGFVELVARPSGQRTIQDSIALTISYIVESKGIPIEIRINNPRGYALMIVKSNTEIKDFSQDLYDAKGNIIQSKRFEPSFERVVEELRGLAK